VLVVKYLRDVIAYEAALLTLQDARNQGREARTVVRLEYDLMAVLLALDAGKRPRRIRREAGHWFVRCGVVGLSFALTLASPPVMQPRVIKPGNS
jgi:hypothetical protein